MLSYLSDLPALSTGTVRIEFTFSSAVFVSIAVFPELPTAALTVGVVFAIPVIITFLAHLDGGR